MNFGLGFFGLDDLGLSCGPPLVTSSAGGLLTPSPLPLPSLLSDYRSSHICFAGSADYSGRLYGLRSGSLAGHLNDLSDAHWRNFRGNLPILSVVMGTFLVLVNGLGYCYGLKGRGTTMLWLVLSLTYVCYLHGAWYAACQTILASSSLGILVHREFKAIAGAVTISCLMVANLVGYVVGPSGIKVLISKMAGKDAMPALAFIFSTFYVGVKLMFHIRDERMCQR